jgi:transposase
VVNAVEGGKTTRQVATLFQVSSSFVSNIHQCWKQTGHVHPKQIGGFRRALLEPYENAVKAQLSDHPSLTLKELQTWLAHEHGLSLSISAMDKFIRQKLGYRYKKNRIRQWTATRRCGGGPEQSRAWQKSCKLSKLVFLDETSTSTDRMRRYGRAFGGARGKDTAPAGHWQTLTFIAGLRAAQGGWANGWQALAGYRPDHGSASPRRVPELL